MTERNKRIEALQREKEKLSTNVKPEGPSVETNVAKETSTVDAVSSNDGISGAFLFDQKMPPLERWQLQRKVTEKRIEDYGKKIQELEQTIGKSKDPIEISQLQNQRDHLGILKAQAEQYDRPFEINKIKKLEWRKELDETGKVEGIDLEQIGPNSWRLPDF